MRGSWPWKFVAIAATLILSPCTLYADTLQPVTQERLLQEPANDWLMYGGNYAGWRFSPLKDIDRQNVKKTPGHLDFSNRCAGTNASFARGG